MNTGVTPSLKERRTITREAALEVCGERPGDRGARELVIHLAGERDKHGLPVSGTARRHLLRAPARCSALVRKRRVATP